MLAIPSALDRSDQRLFVLGPLVGRVLIGDSLEEVDCRPFEVSNGGLGIWTNTPLTPGTTLRLKTGDPDPGLASVQLRVQYCLRNHLNTELYRCGLEAVGTKIDFFGAREGLKIVPTQHQILGLGDRDRSQLRTTSTKYVTRTEAALHDARNYLQVVQSAAQVMEMRAAADNDTSVDTLSKRILKAVAQLAHCIEDIHKDQQSIHSETWTSLSIQTLLKDAVDLCRGLAEHSGVALDIDAVPEQLHVLGKPKALLRVLLNLIVNAKDAAGRSPDKWIRLEAKCVDRLVVIRVTDSGEMPQSLRDKIFAPYFSTKAPSHQTSGIGLTFAQAVIEHHGGTIRLDDETSQTSFIIELPLEARGEGGNS